MKVFSAPHWSTKVFSIKSFSLYGISSYSQINWPLCTTSSLYCTFSPCSLCEPCCVLIACKKKAKRCGLCYHFGPCKCVYVLKPLLEHTDVRDDSKSLICTCCKKNHPDGELGIPCGDGDIIKGDTQPAKSEKDPLIDPESEIQELCMYSLWHTVIYARPWTLLWYFCLYSTAYPKARGSIYSSQPDC